jgi:hypothetical protein
MELATKKSMKELACDWLLADLSPLGVDPSTILIWNEIIEWRGKEHFKLLHSPYHLELENNWQKMGKKETFPLI